MDLQQRLKGTGVALVTPFSNNAIDWSALERLIEHVIAGGVEFLVPLGTTGESATTTDDENRQILDFVIRVNNGRLPVIAGIFGGNNTAALVEKIRGFNFDGIDALLSSNPAYSRPSQEGIYQPAEPGRYLSALYGPRRSVTTADYSVQCTKPDGF